MWEITATALKPEPIDAEALYGELPPRLSSAGVFHRCDPGYPFGFPEQGEWIDRSWSLRLLDSYFEEGLIGDVAISTAFWSPWYVPGVLHDGVPPQGVCGSAWSDAMYTQGKSVIVVGDGAHALEQACIFSKYANRVTVLCPKERLHAPERLINAAAERQVEVRFDTSVETVRAKEGRVVGVWVRDAGRRMLLNAETLLAAPDPAANWHIWGGEDKAQELVRQGRLFLAGVPAGVAYHDHAGQVADGLRVARLIDHSFTRSGGLGRPHAG
jgi:hypothetical protein